MKTLINEKQQAVQLNAKTIGAIESLNFKLQKMKMQDPEEGVNYSEAVANLAEKEYKRFLILLELFPDTPIVPNKIMDTFWHYHILDTKKYHSDCEQVFGGYLHHYPYFGLKGKMDAENLEKAFKETQRLYESIFAESMTKGQKTTMSHCKRACVSYCKRACKSKRG